jgi:hypothetical protein
VTVEAADLAPVVIVDAIKDAIALIRCCATQDDAGILAIVGGTDNLPYLTAMTAAAAAIICRRGELDDASIGAFLGSVAAELTDRLLDQQLSREGGD